MTFIEAAEKLSEMVQERNVIGGVRKIIPIIAPDLDNDILRFLSERHKADDKKQIFVGNYSSTGSYCIVWINDTTSSNYVKD